MHYLDHAATAPVPAAVAEAVAESLSLGWANPSSQYRIGREAAERLESCRATVAKALGCAAGELYFTSCGTEGDNWAIRAALHQNRRVGRHIITTAIEHSAVRNTCRELQQQGYEVTFLTPGAQGVVTAEQVSDALREDTALVSMMLVNNELGTVLPVRQVAQLLRERRSQALLHTDAVQAFLEIPFRADELGADFVALSAHKIGAPKGIGALYIGPRVKHPQPLLTGGGQEKGLRPGTEATGQIAGFAKAVELRTAHLKEDWEHLRELKAYASERLGAVEGVRLLPTGASPHILPFSLVGYPSQNVVNDLSEQEIYISAGSACHQGKASHVIEALRLPKREAAGALRASFGPATTREDIDALAEALRRHRASRFPML
ncbi:MAG: cysteine desulfurase family protein [Oscillospiraceae bacterium]